MTKTLFTCAALLLFLFSAHAQEFIHVQGLLNLNKAFVVVSDDGYMLDTGLDTELRTYSQGQTSPSYTFLKSGEVVTDNGTERTFTILCNSESNNKLVYTEYEGEDLFMSISSATYGYEWKITTADDGKHVHIYHVAREKYLGCRDGKIVFSSSKNDSRWKLIRIK